MKAELKSSFDIYDDYNLRITHIDAEELAEFNFDFFLPQINKILEKRNVSLTVRTTSDYEKTNDIIINGEKLNLYTKKELDNLTFWDTAPRIFFKKVNEILKAKNIDEQFYLLYSGNDLNTILLTKKQFSIISDWIKVDTNNDMEIQVSEAQQVAELWLLGNNILSLNGIQHFSNLKVLEVGSNNLTNLDLSQNTQLKTVFCDNNILTSLVVNQNLLLEYLSCSWNSLSTINLPNSNSFQKLYCTNNQISNLNTNNNLGLKVLRIENNPITTLSLGSNINLEELNFSTTPISNINLSSNLNLKKLTTSSNLTSLNVSQNSSLQELYTQGNNLISVDARNGNNSNMLTARFGNVTQSPILKCIFVDWKDSSTLTNFWIKPYTATYVETSSECNLLLATGESVTKKQFSIYHNPVKNLINIVSDSNFKHYEIVNSEGKIILSGNLTQSTIDTSRLIDGIYFLKLYDGTNYAIKKIIKI